MKPKKSTHPLAARVKRMMQADEDIGKIAQASPVLVGRATELFIQHFLEKAAALATSRNAAQVTPLHLKAAASGDEMLSFLKGLMEGVPDLGDDEEAAPAEPKARKRSKKAEAGKSSPAKRSKGAAGKAEPPGAEPQECKPETLRIHGSHEAAGETHLHMGADAKQGSEAGTSNLGEAAPADVKQEPKEDQEAAAKAEAANLQPNSEQKPEGLTSPVLSLGMTNPLSVSAVQEEDDYDAIE